MGLFNDRPETFSTTEYMAICEGLIAAYWKKTGMPPVLCKDANNQTWVEPSTSKLNPNAKMPSKEEFDAAEREWTKRTGIDPERAVITMANGVLRIDQRAWTTRADRETQDGAALLGGVVDLYILGKVVAPVAFLQEALVAVGDHLDSFAKQLSIERTVPGTFFQDETGGWERSEETETDAALRDRIINAMKSRFPGEDFIDTDGTPIEADEPPQEAPPPQLKQHTPSKDDVQHAVDEAEGSFASLRDRFNIN